jgi:hypothetical protein
MARAKKPEDVNERMLVKLGRIEDLLVNLVALQACVADANRKKVAALLRVNDHRVNAVSKALKREKGKK